MTTHLHREIDGLKQKLLSFSARVEDTLARSVTALNRRDAAAAQAIVDADSELDRIEVEVEEECLKILALYQPVAADLRFVVAVLKMNNDLERIGDLASNIAKRAILLANHPGEQLPVDVGPMADKALSMVNRALDALVNGDAALARQVCADDDEVDEMRRRCQEKIMQQIRQSPDRVELLLAVFSVYRHLERVADMATNVCEDVIYMVGGAIVRHQGPRVSE